MAGEPAYSGALATAGNLVFYGTMDGSIKAFDISMGVRKGNNVLRDRLNAALARDRKRIDAILDAYDIPRAALPSHRDAPSRG